MILAGDVGGTKTALAALDETSATRRIVREATLASREIESFEGAVAAFVGGAPALRVRAACFGVAGPVVDGRCVTTNLPWELEEATLAGALGCPVRLINDLEAAAMGVLDLPDEDFLILQSGERRSGRHMAMIAAGTGLGEAFMIWNGVRYQVVASEGGHADFAPRDELEVDLLRFLRAEFGHVSYERVVSGPGLHHLYRFLQTRAGHAAPDWLRHRLGSEDPSAVISEVASRGAIPYAWRRSIISSPSMAARPATSRSRPWPREEWWWGAASRPGSARGSPTAASSRPSSPRGASRSSCRPCPSRSPSILGRRSGAPREWRGR